MELRGKLRRLEQEAEEVEQLMRELYAGERRPRDEDAIRGFHRGMGL